MAFISNFLTTQFYSLFKFWKKNPKTICEQGKIMEITKTESEEWEAGASY